MRVLCCLPIILSCLAVAHANYLLQAFDAAMAMKANFDYNTVYYREYVNYELIDISTHLMDLVSDALHRSSTDAHGAGVQNCAGIYSSLAQGLAKPALDSLTVIEDAALVYYRIMLEELNKNNVFTKDFDTFYYEFNLRLNESYEHLNDVLLQNVLDALFDMMDGRKIVIERMTECLDTIN